MFQCITQHPPPPAMVHPFHVMGVLSPILRESAYVMLEGGGEGVGRSRGSRLHLALHRHCRTLGLRCLLAGQGVSHQQGGTKLCEGENLY